jgi:hypothetical protein
MLRIPNYHREQRPALPIFSATRRSHEKSGKLLLRNRSKRRIYGRTSLRGGGPFVFTAELLLFGGWRSFVFTMQHNFFSEGGGCLLYLQQKFFANKVVEEECAILALSRWFSGMLKEIDSLEKQYVMEKMGELALRSCSIQSRKPVRSIGHTLDLQVRG